MTQPASAQSLLLAQARNNAWANETLHATVAQLPEQAYLVEYPSFFRTLPAVLNHIYLVDLYYIDASMAGGQGLRVFDQEDILDRSELAQAQAESDARLIAHVAALDPADLTAEVETTRRVGPIPERRDHLLLHLFQHQIHHRGQAHGMLSQAGAAPPQLDDFFLTFGRVETAKPYWSNSE